MLAWYDHDIRMRFRLGKNVIYNLLVKKIYPKNKDQQISHFMKNNFYFLIRDSFVEHFPIKVIFHKM
jgi:hypothetical protein